MGKLRPSGVKNGVRCRDVSVAYEGKEIFKAFSLDFEKGCCTCLLGPSGCGKSTLLRIISGTTSFVYDGEVDFQGDEKLSDSVAWMSQKDLLLPWMTVLDNIILGARLRGQVKSVDTQKARQMLADAGMAEYGNMYPSVLSGGMRQRVALLRTLMEERPVILMDEPFSALDSLTRLKLQDLSAKLTRGKTVILVTHDPMEALRLGDRIVVLGGNPADVVADIFPEGDAPRESGGGVVAKAYPGLLQTLMREGDA